jgi:hypothetical protein
VGSDAPDPAHGFHMVVDSCRPHLGGAWYRAATIKVKKAIPGATPQPLNTRAELQSQYNQYAAFATAGAVTLEALARIFPN